MIRRLVMSVMLIDLGLVVGRMVTFSSIFTLPGFMLTAGSLALTFGAAAIFVIWSTYPASRCPDLGLPSAAGLAGGFIMAAHMALENFGAHVGENWLVTLAVMLGVFALWFGSGWWTARKSTSVFAGAVAGCWAAIVSVILAITFGFLGMFFNVPSADYVATWPEYTRSGWGNPKAFAIANTLDAATSHLVTALLLGTVLGIAGGLLGAFQARRQRSP